MSARPGTAVARAALDALYPSMAPAATKRLANAISSWPTWRLRRVAVGFYEDARRDVVLFGGEDRAEHLVGAHDGLAVLARVRDFEQKRSADRGRTRLRRISWR